MSWCNDPFLNELRKRGYAPILMPRADIAPLEVLVLEDAYLHPVGSLEKVMSPDKDFPLPSLKKDIVCTDIQCHYTGQIDAKLGLRILSGFFATKGITSGSIEAQYKQAKSLVFSLQDILQDKVEVADIDRYIRAAHPTESYTYRLLQANKIYIVTSVIKSRNISIEAKNTSGKELALDANLVQSSIGGNIAVNAQNSKGTTLTYDNKIPMVFAFQAIQLSYNTTFGIAYRFASLNHGMRHEEVNANTNIVWADPEWYVPETPFVRIK